MSKKTSQNLMIQSVEGLFTQIVSFILQLILARILLPEDFGVVALLSTFVNLANTFVVNGLSSALLQRKNATHRDICTVFYIEFIMSILMYMIIFFSAPAISSFYGNPQLTLYLRVFALSIVCGGASGIQQTVSRYNLNFMPSFVAGLSGVFVQSALGIVLALHGGGLWSLIISQLSYSFVRGLLLLVLVRWKPTLEFSPKSFKEMFSYSWKFFLGGIIGTLYLDAFSWIIGKKFSSETLGYYTKGNSIPAVIRRIVVQTTTAVMLPSIAKNKDDVNAVKIQTRNMIAVSSALIFPIMAGVAGVAEEFVEIVLTSKWLPCVPVIKIMCISLALNVINNANMQSYNATGRSDMFLKFELSKRLISIVVILALSFVNYYAMLWGTVLMALLSLVINAIYNQKMFGYSWIEYIIDIVPYVFAGTFLFVSLKCFELLEASLLLTLFFKIFICAIIFVALIIVNKFSGYKMLNEILFNLIRKRKRDNLK